MSEERLQPEPAALGPRPRPYAGRAAGPRPALYAGPGFVRGSLRLFRASGIDVFLHWSWFIAAYFQFRRPELDVRAPGWHRYSSSWWYVAEYLVLFGIVLLHEFGHALACRSVGGRAERIYLWPLGGIALVEPPPRPGAFLWSIAAGPLVNLLLVPVTLAAVFLAAPGGLGARPTDAQWFCLLVERMNLALLALNLLPIHPLDGGQIVQALLWYVIGRARSLLVVTLLGLPIAGGLLLCAVLSPGSVAARAALGLVAGFGVLVCLVGLQRARLLLRILKAPRRDGFHCPACGTAPPVGDFWRCTRCGFRHDTFAAGGRCPGCGVEGVQTMCADCHQSRPFIAWQPGPAPAGLVPPARPVRDRLPPAQAVPLGERLLWAAGPAAVVLVGGLLLTRGRHPEAVAVLALGGAMLGGTGAETLSRAWRSLAARRRLQGTWRLVAVDGKVLTPEDGPAVLLSITGTRFTETTGEDVTAAGGYWLDPTKVPAPLTLVPSRGPGAGNVRLGVWELEDEVWRLCLAEPGAARPESMAAEPGRRRLLVYRKE